MEGREQEQQRFREEERLEVQDRLREEQAEMDRRALDEEEKRAHQEMMQQQLDEHYRQQLNEEEAKHRREEWEEQYRAEVEEICGVLPTVNLEFDPYLHKIYEVMQRWVVPSGVMFVPMLATDPFRILTYISRNNDHMLSCWSDARNDSQGVFDQLDSIVATLRETIANENEKAGHV